MDTQLKHLIFAYQASVRTAVEIMQRSGIPLPTTCGDWVETDIPNSGELEGGIRYVKHGIGCKVDLPTGPVDFDFGRLGEICSGQVIPDTALSFSSATAGASPSLN
jgi:hypothetical protein